MFSDNYIRLCNSVDKGVTVVAEEIGFSANAGAKWANGSTPRPTTLAKIADYFGVTVEELTAETKKPATEIGDGLDIVDVIRLYTNAPAEIRDSVLTLLRAAESSGAILGDDSKA